MHPKRQTDTLGQAARFAASADWRDPGRDVLTREQQEEELDAGLIGSFPASDPVAICQPTTAMPAIASHRRR